MKRWQKLIILVVIFSSFLFFGTTVNAQTPQRSIGISPLRSEVEIPAGTAKTNTLAITNSGANTASITMSAEAFAVNNQSYDYLFKPDANEVSWVSFDKPSLTIAPGQSTTVEYTLSVPITAEPAGYYLAIFATSTPSSLANGITPVERLASLSYITVPGDITRVGTLLRLSSPTIAFEAPKWSATLQNSGSVHYRSVYSVKVANVFGRVISTQEDSRLILPNSIRLVEGTMSAPELLGLYKVTYSIGLGDNPVHQEERWFLFLPPLQTGIVILIILGAIYLLQPSRTKRTS